MASVGPRTAFVRHRLAARPMGPDEYIGDLCRLERMHANRGAMGVATVMAFLNLQSRYPRESDAIRWELGGAEADTRPEEEWIVQLLDERLRLAEARTSTATVTAAGAAGSHGDPEGNAFRGGIRGRGLNADEVP